MSAAFENPENTPQESSSHGAGWKGLLIAALVIALGGNIYLLKRSIDQSDRISQMAAANDDQLSKVNAAAQAAQEESQKQIATLTESLTGFNTAATTAVTRARAEAKKQSEQLVQKLDEQQQAISGEISQVKTVAEDANAKLGEVTTDVSGVKTDVGSVKTDVGTMKTGLATAQTALDEHSAELKRMVGDMGSMSGLIATNAKDLAALRELGERNYFEFTLNRGKMATKAGGIMLTLKKADPKANRYTLDVQADDKHVEKRDRTINEPVQIYVSGSHIPDEIVVNQVKKDQVVGYVSTPKVQLSQR